MLSGLILTIKYGKNIANFKLIRFLKNYSAYNLVTTIKIDKIQIATPHSKRKIKIKYKHRMIEQLKLNTTMFLNFL